MTSIPIPLNGGELMRQATMTAHDYMLSAVEDIDKVLGSGTARKHPELIAAYIQTAAADFGAATIAQQIRSGLDAIADSITSLNENLRSDHPLQGQTFDGIRFGLEQIGAAVSERT